MSDRSSQPDTAVPMGHECDSRSDFTELLQWWYDTTSEATIGDGGTYGGKAWVWVNVGGQRCHLNADSTRLGIGRYLEIARGAGGEPPWFVVANNRGRVNKIVVEPSKEGTPGLFLYTSDELPSPTQL